MVVVRKDTVTVHLKSMQAARVSQLEQENPGSDVIEDARVVDAAVHHMVPRSLVIGAQLARHDDLQTRSGVGSPTGVRPLAQRLYRLSDGGGEGSDPVHPKRYR